MAYWLVKTEPSIYSFHDLLNDITTVWNGVTNPLALKHLRSMKKNDSVLVYHTGNEKAIVGIAQVVSKPYGAPKKRGKKLTVVELRAVKSLQRPIPLSELKSTRECAAFELVRLPRLSVMPVPKKLWNLFMRLGTQLTR